VTAAQAAIGANDEQERILHRLALVQQGMLDVRRAGTEVGSQFGDFARVRLSFESAVQRLFKTRRGDQFHRARDFADVLDRPAALHESTGLGHTSSKFSVMNFELNYNDSPVVFTIDVKIR